MGKEFKQLETKIFIRTAVVGIVAIFFIFNFYSFILEGRFSKTIIANIFMFVPMGFITPVAFKKVRTFPKTILCMVIFSFCIEFIQYFIGRSAMI